MLTSGLVIKFTIAEVLDDSLLGSRVDAPGKACLIHLHAIAMIEFE